MSEEIQPSRMTETPRTDALDFDLQKDIAVLQAQGARLSDIIQHTLCNYDKLSRQLETELTTALKRIEVLEKALMQTCNELRTTKMGLTLLGGATYKHSDIQNFRLLFYSMERLNNEINLEVINAREHNALTQSQTKTGGK